MIIHLFFALALSSHPNPSLAIGESRELTCEATNVASDATTRRCRVDIPAGTKVKACTAAEKAASRCTVDKRARYVAWTVSTSSAKCRVWKKKTKWKNSVGIKVASKTAPGAGGCTLHVIVE